MTFGGLAAGILMSNGRRRTIIIASIIGMIGNLITYYL
jgi:hypothetical protein